MSYINKQLHLLIFYMTMSSAISIFPGKGWAEEYIFGGTNLPIFSSYPDPSCYRPSPPFGRDQYSIEIYRIDLERYYDCLQSYLDNAANDIKRIRAKMKATVEREERR